MSSPLTPRQQSVAADRLELVCEAWARDNGIDLTTAKGQQKALHGALDSLGIPRRKEHILRTYDGLAYLSRIGKAEKAYRSRTRRRARKAQVPIEHVDRFAIIARDGNRCYICNRYVPTADVHIEHMIPLSRGGTHSADNVRVACAQCNWRKGTKTSSEYETTLLNATSVEGL